MAMQLISVYPRQWTLANVVFTLISVLSIGSAARADENQTAVDEPPGYVELEPMFDQPPLLEIPDSSPDSSTIIVLPPVESVELDVPLDLDSVPDATISPQSVIGTSEQTIESHESGLSIEIGDAEEVQDEDEEKSEPLDFWLLRDEPLVSYRQASTGLSWLPGNGQNFGLVEWKYSPYLERGEDSGVKMAFNMTWLSGPHSTPLPARVYEFSAGYQKQGRFSDRFSYDLSARIGVFSDFDGSARDGVRFPSHAVGMLHVNSCTDFVFGADYLDRDDISVLPVVGFSYRPPDYPALRFDMIFPRPRIDYTFGDARRMYVAGRLGGDTWDVDDGIEHVVTYRDYRLLVGFETADDDGSTSSIEFGYVFGRELELRGQPVSTQFDDAFVIRFVSRM